MKRSSRELKRIARDTLNNRYSIPMGAFVTASFIPAVIEIPFSLSLGNYPATPQIVMVLIAEYLILLISQVLNAGVILVHQNMTRNLPYKLTTMFDPFRRGTERYFLAAFLLSLLSIVCCLPLIAGCIFLYFAETVDATIILVLVLCGILSALLMLLLILNYNFVFFFLLDYPEMKVTASFKESRLLMRKNRGRLFYLLCSFLGWGLLTLLSFGIASLWIMPYMNQTILTFYLDCTGELDRIPVRDYNTAPSSSSNSTF